MKLLKLHKKQKRFVWKANIFADDRISGFWEKKKHKKSQNLIMVPVAFSDIILYFMR